MSFDTAADQAATAKAGEQPGSLCIGHLAVIGAGREGIWLAQRAASVGYSVTLEDLLPGRRRAASLQLDNAAGGRLISYAATVEEACRQADMVVDFVPDELESKLEIFSLLDRMAPPRTIFATPTRSLSIADLASCTYRQDRCIALRFSPDFLTAERFQVQLVRTPQSGPLPTGDTVVELVATFWQSLGGEATVEIDYAPLP